MRYEMLVGLHISDPDTYHRYRQAMRPILHRYDGDFGYDLTVSKVLAAPTAAPINRVFTIHFPSREVADRFFSDSSYGAVRNTYFDASVTATTIMASYERPT